MEEKNEISVHVKLTPRLNRLIEDRAAKNDRTKMSEVLRLIKIGLHVEQFDSSAHE
jgi:hypothetical protein